MPVGTTTDSWNQDGHVLFRGTWVLVPNIPFPSWICPLASACPKVKASLAFACKDLASLDRLAQVYKRCNASAVARCGFDPLTAAGLLDYGRLCVYEIICLLAHHLMNINMLLAPSHQPHVLLEHWRYLLSE